MPRADDIRRALRRAHGGAAADPPGRWGALQWVRLEPAAFPPPEREREPGRSVPVTRVPTRSVSAELNEALARVEPLYLDFLDCFRRAMKAPSK
jgi:hypothetical protein